MIDAAFGTGFRGAYDTPGGGSGGPRPGRRHPRPGWPGTPGRRRARCSPPTATVTFVAAQPGLLQGDGPRLAGDVRVVDIGLPIGGHRIDHVEDADIGRLVPDRAPRRATSGGSAVLVVAGSPGMTGAAGPGVAGRLPGRGGHGPPGRARVATRPTCRPARRWGITLPAQGWATMALTVRVAVPRRGGETRA